MEEEDVGDDDLDEERGDRAAGRSHLKLGQAQDEEDDDDEYISNERPLMRRTRKESPKFSVRSSEEEEGSPLQDASH